MTKLSYLTPDGRITIPRSIMKFLNIKGGDDITFDIKGGMLIIEKTEIVEQASAKDLIYTAV